MVRRSSGPLATWMNWRKFSLAGSLIAILLLGVFINLSVGTVALLSLLAATKIWRKVGQEPDHPNLGGHIYGTRSYRVEVFFSALDRQLPNMKSLTVFGFGPPEDDEDHELERGLLPPTRLSSYWALVCAILLSGIDYLTAGLRYPVWGTVLPATATQIVGFISWFIIIQMFLHVRRTQGKDWNSLAGDEPAPAVMLHLVKTETSIVPILIKGVSLGFGTSLFIAIIMLVMKANWTAILIQILATTILTALFAVSKMMVADYRAKWQERQDRRDFWQDQVFMTMMKPEQVPSFIAEFQLPDEEEHESAEQRREGVFNREVRRGIRDKSEVFTPEPYDPDVTVAAFAMSPGATFFDYYGLEERLKNVVGVESLAIVPVGIQEPNEDGEKEERPGTVGSEWFRIWVPTKPLVKDFLDPDIGIWHREFLIFSEIIPILSNIRAIGFCSVISSRMLTSNKSTRQLLELQLVPESHAVDIGDFIKNVKTIESNLGVEWVRVIQQNKLPADEVAAKARMIDEGREEREAIDSLSARTFIMLIGDRPLRGTKDEIQFSGGSAVSSKVWRMIDAMDWGYNFSVAGITDSTGAPPEYLYRAPATRFVDKIVFDVPPGLSLEAIKSERNISGIKQNAGYEFLEITSGGNMPEGLSEEEKILAESKYRPGFSMVAARTDPLKRVFTFGEYKDKILQKRELGVAKLDWVAGVFADDTLAIYKRGSDSPHLLVGGESGGGKSVLISSMLAQKTHNNGPYDLQLWLIEPKTELQVWEDVDIVTRFVDSWTPDKQFMANVALLSQDAVDEMERRNELMAQWRRDHGQQVRDIDQARKIALAESKRDGTDVRDHPLFFPFIEIIMEECATLFSEVPKEDRESQGQVLRNFAELARKARSAGILCTFITQYPTNASIPSVIRQQCARIGLKTRNSLASTVIIEESGLEQIRTKGVGMLRQGDEYRRFRALWVRDEVRSEGGTNDIEELLDDLPLKGKSRVVVSGGQTVEEQDVPDVPSSVFAVWDKQFGVDLDDAITAGRTTKDITDDDL